MRDPIENVTRLQKQLNNLQLENQVLRFLMTDKTVKKSVRTKTGNHSSVP